MNVLGRLTSVTHTDTTTGQIIFKTQYTLGVDGQRLMLTQTRAGQPQVPQISTTSWGCSCASSAPAAGRSITASATTTRPIPAGPRQPSSMPTPARPPRKLMSMRQTVSAWTGIISTGGTASRFGTAATASWCARPSTRPAARPARSKVTPGMKRRQRRPRCR